jgi:phosphohistidine phosphatase
MTVKHLYVLRHAKSSWDDPGLDDHERPLAPRGRRAVEALAAYLRDRAIEPSIVLCSSARRTRETLEGVERLVGQRVIERELYAAGPGALLERLHRVPEETSSVMLIGHNPAVQVLVLRLAEAAGDGDLAEVARKFPTGALATLEFECGWAELAPGRARLTGFVRPKQLQRRSRSG